MFLHHLKVCYNTQLGNKIFYCPCASEQIWNLKKQTEKSLNLGRSLIIRPSIHKIVHLNFCAFNYFFIHHAATSERFQEWIVKNMIYIKNWLYSRYNYKFIAILLDFWELMVFVWFLHWFLYKRENQIRATKNQYEF